MLLIAVPAAAENLRSLRESAATPPGADASAGMIWASKTMDIMLMDVASIVPGFGGMYLDAAEQVLYVYAVGNEDAAALRRAIAAVFGPEIVPNGGVRVIPGKYTVPQLFGWYQLINEHIFSLPDVTATDLQEAGNHLSIGITHESVRAQVEGEIERLGIPRDAVAIEVSGPVIPANDTLVSAVRPVDAGVQIENQENRVTCTFGFSALLNGGGPGTVTNSHCTRNMGTVESDRFHQPLYNGTTNLIGVEAIDPPLFNTYPCPAGKRCRYSDSVYVANTGNITLNQGYIARLRIPTETDHPFRFIPTTCSEGKRPPIPRQSDHRFRFMPTTFGHLVGISGRFLGIAS